MPGIDLQNFEDDSDLEATSSFPKLNEKIVSASRVTRHQSPPVINYGKLYDEVLSCNITIDPDPTISDVLEYIVKLQGFRSRLILLESQADINYVQIDAAYEVLLAHELTQRPEKTAKEKEAASLLALKTWFEAQTDAKSYRDFCKRHREQLDSTYHSISKILAGFDLEVRMRNYSGGEKPSVEGAGSELKEWNY